jgi:hypothetical protein
MVSSISLWLQVAVVQAYSLGHSHASSTMATKSCFHNLAALWLSHSSCRALRDRAITIPSQCWLRSPRLLHSRECCSVEHPAGNSQVSKESDLTSTPVVVAVEVIL